LLRSFVLRFLRVRAALRPLLRPGVRPVPALVLLLPVLAVLFAGACGDDGDDGMAGDDDDDDMMVGDDDDDMMAGDDDDDGPLMSQIFGPCTQSADCVDDDENALCRPPGFGYATGSCSRRCEAGGGCSVRVDGSRINHVCLDDDDAVLAATGLPRGLGNTCHELCDLSASCEPGQVCATQTDAIAGGQPTAAGNTCIPWACAPDGTCAGDAICGPGGFCIDADDMSTGTAGIGEPCGSANVCASGLCDTAPLAGARRGGSLSFPVVFPRLCAANCILPPGYNSINFYDPAGSGPGLPEGSCGAGNVCLPRFFQAFFGSEDGDTFRTNRLEYFEAASQLGQRDPGRCFRGCAGDDDCESGQVCVNEFTSYPLGSEVFSYGNGVCLPDPNDAT